MQNEEDAASDCAVALGVGEHKLQLLIFGTATTGRVESTVGQSVEIINKFTALPWAAMARNSGPEPN